MQKIRLFLLITAGFILSATLTAGEYHVDKNRENLVKFISDAPLENFGGETDQIDGYLFWEGEDLTNKSAVYFEVDLKTLDTGIGLRNRHMRENYLETDQFPLTSFKGRITEVRQSPGDTLMIKSDGKIFIHGVEKQLSVDARLIPDRGGYRIQSQFFIKLSDFSVEIPSIMFYKIDENMDLRLDFYIKLVKGAE